MSGALMEKVWGLIGMDTQEEEEYEFFLEEKILCLV